MLSDGIRGTTWGRGVMRIVQSDDEKEGAVVLGSDNSVNDAFKASSPAVSFVVRVQRFLISAASKCTKPETLEIRTQTISSEGREGRHEGIVMIGFACSSRRQVSW
jgi:hypothetical protein